MNKWFKIAASLLILGIIIGILGYRFVYNKPHVNYEKAKAEFMVTGEQIFRQYTGNRPEAEQKYNGKVLAVEGRVTAVEIHDSLTIVVFELTEGLFGEEGIRFSMLENHGENARTLNEGELVTIKGYCTGYNDTDVILEKCSIIN